MRRKKGVLSPAERHATANATVGNALAMFEKAVQALDDAAEQHNAVVADLEAQVNDLTTLMAKADSDAMSTQRVADKIRTLIS